MCGPPRDTLLLHNMALYMFESLIQFAVCVRLHRLYLLSFLCVEDERFSCLHRDLTLVLYFACVQA